MKHVLSVALLGVLAAGPAVAAGMSSDSGQSSSYQSGQIGSMATDQSTVRQVQQALKDKGYEVGPVDGIAGSQTRQALMQFQRDQRLPETGQLDQQTVAALDVQDGMIQQGQTPAEQGVGGAGSVGQPEQAPGLGGPPQGEAGVGRVTPGGGMRDNTDTTSGTTGGSSR